MYKYEYVKVKCHLSGWGAVHGYVYNFEEFKTVIDERAQNGWRYVGYIPSRQRGTGHIQELELIFEKKIEKKEKA